MKESEQPPKEKCIRCMYSKAMDQPSPRLCVICGVPEKVQVEEPAHTVDNRIDTPISSLRNKLTPFLNLALMVLNVESNKIQHIIKKESLVCNQNAPDVLQLLDDIEKSVSPSPERGESDGWISVKDQLPIDTTSVLVKYSENSILIGEYLGHLGEWRLFWRDGYKAESKEEDRKITHWQHLPKPPKQ